MLFGHIGAGYAAKRFAPRVSLGFLLGATTAIDTLFGVLWFVVGGRADAALAWAHGLLMSAVWTVVIAAVAYLAARDLRSALVLGFLTFGHWVLDFVSHPMGMGKPLPPDLPLALEGSTRVGLGLYNHSLALALVVDMTLFVGGIVLYLTGTRATSRRWVLPFVLMMAFIGALTATVALSSDYQWVPCLLQALLIPLGLWLDRHRTPRARGLVLATT